MKQESRYEVYNGGTLLSEAFPKNKIPMLKMQDLRLLDFSISIGVSYERTVDDFLGELEFNDALRCLRDRAEIVVLLDRVGALVREKGEWSLIFTPDQVESQSIGDDDSLYQIYAQLLEREKKGEVCRVKVPWRSLKMLLSGASPFSILDEYCKTQPGSYLAVAERIVYQGTEELISHVPVCRFGTLVTADKEEIEKYNSIKSLFDDYIYQFDHLEGDAVLQPLSVAVFGPPGCGKSFGVRQIAKSCGRFQISSINLSQYNSPSELFEALREVLQYKNNIVPLVFFDEFDSELNGVSRGWLKYFLAPMQDGEFISHGRLCTINGAVFVFAGATAFDFESFLPSGREEEEAFRAVKGTDFVSRLKGILNIKGPNPSDVTDRSYVIRRAMLIHEQLLRKAPSICSAVGLVNMSRNLLSALLSVSEYRHGSRSIEMILAMSRLSGVNRFSPSCLPVDEQMNIHLDVRSFRKKLSFEQMMGNIIDRYAEAAHEEYRRIHMEEAERGGGAKEEAEGPDCEAEMAEWKDLDEYYKEGYRSRLRYMGESLMDYDMNIGIRPVLEGSEDSIPELYGPALETIARIEHERWVNDKEADGWKYGEVFDSEVKQNPDLTSYEELEEMTRDFIRRSVRNLPSRLKEIGYELYRRN